MTTTFVNPLKAEQLYTACDLAHIPFETSDEVTEHDRVVGQERALDAIHFGTRITGSGYNVFALGPAGTGKYTVVRHILEVEAENKPTPPDWCYVYNFQQPHKPNALQLPAGRGIALRKDMDQLTEDLSTAIPAAFESEDYQAQVDKLEQDFATHRDEALNQLADEAKEKDVQLIHTPTGFAFAPLDKKNEVIRPDQFEKLSDDEKQRLENTVADLQKRLQRIIRQFPAWQKETREKIKEVDRQIARLAVGHLIGVIKEKNKDLSDVVEYLNAAEEDIVEHVKDFRAEPETPMLFGGGGQSRAAALQRYKVNLIVDHSGKNSAPVVYQDLPTHSNLMGRTEYQSQMGTLVTDFTLIKAGDLHRANGGYLILDVRHLLMQPFAWESLKRALRSKEIRIEPLERSLGLISTISLEPEPVSLDVKVVLLGDRLLYYLLSQYDPEFRDLFKVAADFEDTLQRDAENCADFARLIGSIAKEQSLKPIDNKGTARLIEHGARLAGDAEKISVHLRSICDLLQEANYWTGEQNQATISSEQVQEAIDRKIQRLDRVRAHIYEAIERGIINIDTSGAHIGQINGLSVIDLGDFSFGQPSRITATTRLGDGKVIDIERETELGGKIHSKGVLILSHFLASRYATNHPLSLSASLVFEQSYGMVDGDSASMGELCSLLSALAQTPIQQRFAVTGSVNQLGKVQAIGGVNQKVEGFFDVCSAKGFTGDQGVLIPASNVKHLMLRKDVVEAVEKGQFNVYAVETVDQAIEILTGVAAGERDQQGNFPEDSINGKVEKCMVELANLRKSFAHKEHEASEGSSKDENESTK
ncbi:MAG: AAA family ATPase [Gammaproteobacteria bacterium]|nr:AAA family ATPase [Gammaproteobacteria bacterium]